ncbi:ImmA/IrrE family metallo-endopeptidase [Oceanimonas smirnovii]|uniref:ImmA/IrrE family metallo-endopeptidase n=1 Tax=Oceanimonas smirnovii TaxID=264574 RepID=UPI003FD0BA33
MLRPEELAKIVLDEYWEAGRFPVDPIQIARGMSLKVFDAELPGDVSGAIIKKPGQDASIFINAGDSRQRRRFTCAHELGHYVDHLYNKDGDFDEYEIIEYRDNTSGTGRNPDEVFANQFAANLLMPQNEVKKLHRQDVNRLEMAKYFDASPESINYRLINLRLAK